MKSNTRLDRRTRLLPPSFLPEWTHEGSAAQALLGYCCCFFTTLLAYLMVGLFWFRIRPDAECRTRLRSSGETIFASTHPASADTVIVVVWVLLLAPRKTWSLIDWIFFFIPGLGIFLRRIPSFPIGRKRALWSWVQRKKKSLSPRQLEGKILALKGSGHGLLLFPEGKRNPFGALLPLHSGVERFSRSMSYPVLPLAVRRTRGVPSYRLVAGNPILPGSRENEAGFTVELARVLSRLGART